MNQATSNEVYDLLVVGGGPGGTAAAFRAVELGLKPLVIDYDDFFKRIRDYPKSKLILPGFGGGDKMKFPKAGALISALRFADIDKDDLCLQWKSLYKKHRVPGRVGVELTGAVRQPSGLFKVTAWDYGKKQECHFFAKHMVMAVGHGVPRRFDIAGDTDGIAFRLNDPADFVGRPVCIIGGGTSAAEAAIAISNEKVKAKDPSAVYWSYRGDRLPRVSRALSGVFFEAYLGNGNIRYFPKSEPAAVVTAEDQRQYLSIRVDRRHIEGRPNEATYLEFPKEDCLACIGEDIPEPLLGGLGIHMVNGGPKNKKRMVVTPHLESVQPNIFLIGDLLSQAYFETLNFKADPREFKEVKHRGNIKSALRDGVLVAEVIAAKLQGKKNFVIRLQDDEDLPGPARPVLASPRETSHGEGAILIRLLPGGASENEYPLKENGPTSIGRSGCDITFPQDNLLSNRHASVVGDGGRFTLVDGGSPSGVFLRLTQAKKHAVRDGDLIRCGRQFLLFSHKNGVPKFHHFDHLGKEHGKYEVGNKVMVLGRMAPDVTLNSDDNSLSRRHLALIVDNGTIYAKDLGSANGSFIRVRDSVALGQGDRFFIGQQEFVFSGHRDAVTDSGHDKNPSRKLRILPQQTSAPVAGGPSVNFVNLGKTFAVAEGQTICDVAEQNGLSIVAECHAGICGSDPIRVVSGWDNLVSPPSDQECEAIEEICDLDPKECRLACQAHVKGPVSVEILEV